MTAQSHTAQRDALSPFECYPGETGPETRTAFLCLRGKCRWIFGIPAQTEAPV